MRAMMLHTQPAPPAQCAQLDKTGSAMNEPSGITVRAAGAATATAATVATWLGASGGARTPVPEHEAREG